ncbi:FAD-binding oxidoreductase [Cyanobacterium sp. IPPAS B-1200]|uniref:FAD-binding oxidoreductase n=1 Tax=Cyanobacterium sp. IPPAS B-1200 TaxID=1562720 RepID=UPI0008527DF2|nr:FAD-binding oxidoreductase [Cyanobacterium sp. IPPAS B-1200]OEJ80141.1 FAD-linked oxidase [Cyanobacterium sp. IPPAS B-1200]
MSSINYQNIINKLGSIKTIIDSEQVKKLSQDYYYFSPILLDKLADKTADLVVQPSNEEEVLKVAQICVKHKIPLTVRGAGTGNYGQCIPLHGGIVLDMTEMRQIHWIKNGSACVQAGVKMATVERATRKEGWELRMIPSTYKIATIGGFFGGGSGGIGSINYGQLRDRGNLHRVKVVTLEDEPRILELKGDETNQINHAYGTNGIITELEIPLAPAYNWLDVIITFPNFMDAAKFGQELGDSDGIIKRLISVHASPIPEYFTALKNYLPKGESCALLTVSENSINSLLELVKEYQGKITYQEDLEKKNSLNLIEFTWNHTTFHARNIDPNITYLQTFFFSLEKVEQMYKHFEDEVMIHLEFMRVGGKAIPAGLQLVRYTNEERLNEIIQYHEQNGAFIANPHTYILEDGGRKHIEPEQLKFKKMVDPYGLMNQGKMKAWTENS